MRMASRRPNEREGVHGLYFGPYHFLNRLSAPAQMIATSNHAEKRYARHPRSAQAQRSACGHLPPWTLPYTLIWKHCQTHDSPPGRDASWLPLPSYTHSEQTSSVQPMRVDGEVCSVGVERYEWIDGKFRTGQSDASHSHIGARASSPRYPQLQVPEIQKNKKARPTPMMLGPRGLEVRAPMRETNASRLAVRITAFPSKKETFHPFFPSKKETSVHFFPFQKESSYICPH